MIKVDTPEFFNGINLLMLDTIPSFKMLERILKFDIKCYYRTFDDLHPLAIGHMFPKEGRCLIVTINPSVVDHMGYSSVEHTRESTLFMINGILQRFNDDEANEMYRSYQVGIQHVSEIMLTHNYWAV